MQNTTLHTTAFTINLNISNLWYTKSTMSLQISN